MLSEERLQLTEHGNNHNKFYWMVELSATELVELGLTGPYFRATWGRVGNKGQSRNFPMGQWTTKLVAKQRKGYVRLTNLLVVEDQTPAPEEDPFVDRLLQQLQSASREQVRTSYELAAFGAVTKAQLDKVQELLSVFGDMIVYKATMFALTNQLAMIWTILPRKLAGDLRKQKIASYEQARKKLQIEQDTIDALTAQVVVAQSGGQPISAALGLTFTQRDDLMKSAFPDFPYICDHDGTKRGRVDAMWTVMHQGTSEVYNAYKNQDPRLNEALFFHGSRNENWMSIFGTGLQIRPAGVSTNGDMFGRGIYFADRPMKSLGYCGLSGVGRWASGDEDSVYVALFQVNVGKQFDLRKRGDENKLRVSEDDITLQKLRPFGYDSVAVKADYQTEYGTHIYNNEYIVYESERVTVAALARVRPV